MSRRSTTKPFERGLSRDDDAEYDALTPEGWEKAWADEIALRLADYRAGRAQKVDLGGLLENLRDKI